MPSQLDKWFDRASTVSSAEPLTTPSRSRASRPRGGSRGKIEGPNLDGLPCSKGRDRVQRARWHK